MNGEVDDGVDGLQELLEAVIGDATRVAVLGCGSLLRGDDAAGTEVALRLAALDDLGGSRGLAFAGHVAPENLTGQIKVYAPDLLLVVDAIDSGTTPGSVSCIDKDAITGVSFSTHMLPLKIIVDYLGQETGADIVVLGIQTEGTEFMAEMSFAVSRTVAGLAGCLYDLLSGEKV